MNLSYSNFAYASMRYMYNQITRFDCATFLGVQTRGSSFVRASFENVIGQYALFASTFFEGASFKDAGLQGSSFEGASLRSTSFEGARLSEANLRNTSFYEKISFARADLEGATIVSRSNEDAYLLAEERAESLAA